MRRMLVVSLGLAAALGGTAAAAEGRIPLLTLPGPPYIITQPGNYILTRNIGYAAGTVIAIQSDGVTLDLNGNTVTGPSAVSAITILVTAASGTDGIVIKNGRIVAGATAVGTTTVRLRLRIEGLDISGSAGGVSLIAEYADVIGCRIHDLVDAGGASTAIFVNALGGRILDNLIQNLPGNGIIVRGFRAGEIRRNVVRNFGGFWPSGYGVSLEDSTPIGDSGGSIVADNTVSSLPSGVDDAGIRVLTSNNLIVGNVAANNGGRGIYVTGNDNRLERNVTNKNGDEGIAFSLTAHGSHLESNQSQTNQGCGFELGGASLNIYRGNLFTNNVGGNICGVPGITAGGNYCNLTPCP